MITGLAALRLRYELDRALWQNNDHLEIKTLWDYLATYLYLPRLRDEAVLIQAIEGGVAQLTWADETFAYAEGWDEAKKRYRGLVCGQHARIVLDGHSVLVKAEAALRQIEGDRQKQEDLERQYSLGLPEPPTEAGPANASPSSAARTIAEGVERDGDLFQAGLFVAPVGSPTPPRLRRFHGVAELDTMRIGRDAGRIAEEIVQHLSTLPSASVRVRLEIEADIPEGTPDSVVRTVSENCRTLRFVSQGFEEE